MQKPALTPKDCNVYLFREQKLPAWEVSVHVHVHVHVLLCVVRVFYARIGPTAKRPSFVRICSPDLPRWRLLDPDSQVQ